MPERLFWCNAHQRQATSPYKDSYRCDPTIPKTLMPCRVVDLTGAVELDEHEDGCKCEECRFWGA